MSNKSPAFQWYAKDFLSDLNVIRMSTEEVGAYILLISVCWVEESLPSSLDDLALIARMPLEKFKKSWEKRLNQCFVLNEKTNTFCHPRLLKEIKKQKHFRKNKSKAGIESGRKRREQKQLGDEQVFDSVQTEVEQVFEQKRTLLSSSSTSVDLKEKEQKKAQRSKTTRPVDKAFLLSLSTNPAYEGINISREFAKAKTWAAENNREMNTRFLVNWMNGAKPEPSKPKDDSGLYKTSAEIQAEKEYLLSGEYQIDLPKGVSH